MHHNETARDMDKLKILKAASGKNRFPQKIVPISYNKNRWQKPIYWQSHFQGKQICHFGIQYLTTLSFKREGEIKMLADE